MVRRYLSEWIETKLELTEVKLASPCRTHAFGRNLDWLPSEFSGRELSPLDPEVFRDELSTSSMVFETLANADHWEPQQLEAGRSFEFSHGDEYEWGETVQPSRPVISYLNPDQFPLEANRSGMVRYHQASLLDPECFL